MPKADLSQIEQTASTGYPEPYARDVAGRHYRRVGAAMGLAARGASVADATVADLMTGEVVTGSPTDGIEDTAHTMTNRRVRHIPVVVNDELAAIVSIGDVVKFRIDQLTDERNHLLGYLHT